MQGWKKERRERETETNKVGPSQRKTDTVKDRFMVAQTKLERCSEAKAEREAKTRLRRAGAKRAAHG